MRKFGVKRGGKGEVSAVKKGIKADISRVSPLPVRPVVSRVNLSVVRACLL